MESSLARLILVQNHLSIQPCFHQHAIHNDNPTGPADLDRERADASFNVEEMTEVLYEGKENVEAMRLAYQIIQRDPDLRMSGGHHFDLTRAEDREQTMRQIARAVEYVRQIKEPRLRQAFLNAMALYSESYSMRMYVHDILFRQAMLLFGSPEQQDKWMDDIINWRVIGCFAMTELGHSSNLRGLETTSTYDHATNEWVIHSPTLTSTKWWIGMSGETATHTVAICQTVVDGVNHGINWFIVPLRNLKTGKLLPGVTCGDIGHKYGRQGLDNGWIQFTAVRIPRDNMLMKWASISPEGKFKPSPNPVLSYATLIPERFTLLGGSQVFLSQALTIAVRYGAVRRQGNKDEQILDYQTHYTSLMPGVALGYMLNIVDRVIMEKWNQVADYARTDSAAFMREIPDQHGVSAGFKASVSWYITEVLESCRRACGGHAYSSYNAIAGLIGDYGVYTTGGGDNVVLMQQTARYLVATLKAVYEGQKVSGSVSYFNDHKRILAHSKTTLQDTRDLYNFEFVVDALTWACTKKATDLVIALNEAGKASSDEAWNANQRDLVRLAGVHSWRYFLVLYHQGIERHKSKPLFPVLQKIGNLMSTVALQRHMSIFLEENYFDGSQAKQVNQVFIDQCKDLRKDAVPLVDAWEIPDYILKAPIGKYDGNIYPAYFGTVSAAQKSHDPPAYWHKYFIVLSVVRAFREHEEEEESSVVETRRKKLDEIVSRANLYAVIKRARVSVKNSLREDQKEFRASDDFIGESTGNSLKCHWKTSIACYGDLDCLHHSAHGLCRNVALKYARNDLLSVPWAIDPEKDEYPSASTVEKPWATPDMLLNYKTLLLNRGLIWRPDEVFMSELSFIAPHAPSQKAFKSVPERSEAQESSREVYRLTLADVQRQSKIAKEIVEASGGIILDTEAMFAMRPDGRMGEGGCARLCAPGPLDAYADLPYNTCRILQV
ncbi:acyl-Coenzyme A oxidase [Entomortierella chlamydospora]|uniref:acyl-CoA oxidase n=1 Tax=Entomortierella chlamydospora TaxID=101097 RepID=A0A9P6ML55_9FUNG|nr:acyl-Coenzyme A oxidase [Entomortierella chlamydospora]